MSSVTIRACAPKDMRAVHDLYKTTFGRDGAESWKARYAWQFFDTPGAEVRPSQFHVACIGGRVCGFLAAFPVRRKMGNDVRVVLSPCDLMVAPSAGGHNLGGRLLHAHLRQTDGHLSALAYNPANEKLFDSLRARSVLLAPIALRPLNLRAIGMRAIRSSAADRLARVAPFSWVVEGLGRGASLAGRVLHRLTLPRIPRGYTLEQVSDIGAEFDQLWARTAPLIPVVTVRDRRFVKWRFRDDPAFSHTVLAARDAKGTLRGYVVSCVVDKRGLRHGKVMDLFCDPAATDTIDTLLHGVLSTLRHDHADLVVVKGLHRRIRKRVHRFVYLKPRVASPAARLLHGRSEPNGAMAYDADNWHVAHADGDFTA